MKHEATGVTGWHIGKRGLPQARHGAGRRRLAMEPPKARQLLSVTVIDSEVAFATDNQNMWASGPEASVTASSSHNLLDVDFSTQKLGGFVDFFRKTGLEVAFGGGLDLGFGGDFYASGGGVDVDHQTDLTVSALTTSDGTLGTLAAEDHFLPRAAESPDPATIAMETEFANISARMYLDYDADVSASMLGKIDLEEDSLSTRMSRSCAGMQI